MDEKRLQALLDSPDCRYDFRGPYRSMTRAEEAKYYTNRVRANYADKTAMVQRIIASKGKSI